MIIHSIPYASHVRDWEVSCGSTITWPSGRELFRFALSNTNVKSPLSSIYSLSLPDMIGRTVRSADPSDVDLTTASKCLDKYQLYPQFILSSCINTWCMIVTEWDINAHMWVSECVLEWVSEWVCVCEWVYLEMHCTCSTERVVMCKLKFEKKDLNGTPVVKRRVHGLRSFDTVYLINQWRGTWRALMRQKGEQPSMGEPISPETLALLHSQLHWTEVMSPAVQRYSGWVWVRSHVWKYHLHQMKK
jgi:hypothetical protein